MSSMFLPKKSPQAQHSLQLRENVGLEIGKNWGEEKSENSQIQEFWLNYLKQKYHPKKPLTKEERLKINETWKENESQLTLLHNESKELSQIFDSLQLSIKLLTKEQAESFSKALKFIKESKENIAVFKQLRFWELGGVDTTYSDLEHMAALLEEHHEGSIMKEWLKSCPNDAFFKISKDLWKQSAFSYVEEIMKLIGSYKLDYNQLEPDQELPLEAVEVFVYSFKIIDLLYKNDFINKADLQKFFQDNEIFKKAVLSGIRNLNERTVNPILYCIDSITKDWFWPFGFEFIRDFNKEYAERCQESYGSAIRSD
ncbi:hypothetical protein PGTUg99_026935 [Puccinia graminis f. sp. tritici]|uniref:Uncharacterized protein n=1 Tax=Puccinia graminis f. sp. tritici TaxID=56615 RepID=A0A5B0PLY7_PUCGR|nr:hypothetical protein PGTUg99_026935 [Puccinia graminis f. sp. tritici]